MVQVRQERAMYHIIVCQTTSKCEENGRENLPKANSCYVCSAHFTPDCCETSLKETFGIKTKKSLKPGSVPSIFPFLYRKPEREMSHKRKQIREKIARDEILIKYTYKQTRSIPFKHSNIIHILYTVYTRCNKVIHILYIHKM